MITTNNYDVLSGVNGDIAVIINDIDTCTDTDGSQVRSKIKGNALSFLFESGQEITLESLPKAIIKSLLKKTDFVLLSETKNSLVSYHCLLQG